MSNQSKCYICGCEWPTTNRRDHHCVNSLLSKIAKLEKQLPSPPNKPKIYEPRTPRFKLYCRITGYMHNNYKVFDSIDAVLRFSRDNYVWLQYIEIKAICGRELSEGDIVTGKHERTEVKGTIIYEGGEFLVEQDDDTFPLCSITLLNNIKLLGNVYQGIK